MTTSTPEALFFPILAYLLGSLSLALWIGRRLRGVDLRMAGSGHATTTNTIRQVGWAAGVLVFLFDVAKGFLPTWLAAGNGMPAWVIALTAAAGVAGHCWPIYYHFRGGMGLATAGGAYLAASPLALLIGLAVLIASVLLTRHGARGSLIASLVTPGLLWLLGFPAVVLWIGLLAGLVTALRFTSDWRRTYRELWLDRQP